MDNQTISTELSQYIESHTHDQIKGAGAFCSLAAAKTDNIFIQEIKFDEQLWSEEILPTLKTFYLNAVVPEILTRKLQKELFLLALL